MVQSPLLWSLANCFLSSVFPRIIGVSIAQYVSEDKAVRLSCGFLINHETLEDWPGY